MNSMIKNILTIILIIPSSIVFPTHAQQGYKATYVIVHGAWGGSWAFREVDSLLTAKGCLVYRPCLTGQGERVHLASRDIGLQTHINDVVNVFLFEELHDVILVGHSYGGMVVTGVADSLPDRIQKIIYVDAFMPEDGESLFSITGGFTNNRMKEMEKNGFLVPAWVDSTQGYPSDVPHSLKTVTDPVALTGRGQYIPVEYILTVDEGADPSSDGFASQADRARRKGIRVHILTADHNPQWSAPEELVKMLFDLR